MLISNVVVDWLNNALHALLLLLDEVVYWAASQCYQLFIKLANTRLFEESFFANFANRIYAILGIFMLFYLAYALLTAIVDPEKFVKGDKGVSKIATNLVVSLVILGFLPTIFSYAYRMQNYILSSNLIGSLILGTSPVDVEESQEVMVKYGDVLSFTVLNTFLNPDNVNFTYSNNYSWYNFKDDVLSRSDYTSLPGMNKAVATGVPVNGEQTIIFYMPIISTAVGVFLIYVMISFTIDLGIRVIKFAFCQLLAPIPVIMRVVPGKKGTFDKWLKQTLSVYFEVFVRVGIMYMAVYFINAIATNADLAQFFGEGSGVQGKLAFVVVIMGILAFAKQAPKMLSDMLGINTGGLKLGIQDKLKAGGFFTGAGMLGAGFTGFSRNLIGGLGNVWKQGSNSVKSFAHGNFKEGLRQLGGAALGIGSGALSTLAGTTSGMFNAYKTGKDAKNFGDMKKAAEAGAKASFENKEKRANYIASHNGIIGATTSRIIEGASGAKKWATGSGFSEKILAKIKFRDELKKLYDNSYKDLFNSPDYQNMDSLLNSYQSQLDAGLTTVNGQANGPSLQVAIDNLKEKMKLKRLDTISKNKEATAYAAYNLAQFIKQNPEGAADANFDLNGIDVKDLVLRNNKVYRKSTKAELTENELSQIFESLTITGNPISGKGVKDQVRDLNKENKRFKQSVEYQELQKKEAAQKK